MGRKIYARESPAFDFQTKCLRLRVFFYYLRITKGKSQQPSLKHWWTTFFSCFPFFGMENRNCAFWMCLNESQCIHAVLFIGIKKMLLCQWKCFPNTCLGEGMGRESKSMCGWVCTFRHGKILEKSSCEQCFAANLKRRQGSDSTSGQKEVQQRLHKMQLCGRVHLLLKDFFVFQVQMFVF